MWKSGIDDGVKTGNAAEYYPVKSKFVKRVKISKMLVVKIFLGFFPVRLSTPGKDNSRQHSFMHDVGLQSSFIYTWELHHQLRPHLAHFHLFLLSLVGLATLTPAALGASRALAVGSFSTAGHGTRHVVFLHFGRRKWSLHWLSLIQLAWGSISIIYNHY